MFWSGLVLVCLGFGLVLVRLGLGLIDRLGFMLGAYALDIGLKRYKTRFKALFQMVAGLYAWGVLTLCVSVLSRRGGKLTNYVKQTGVMAGKTIFDFEKSKTPPDSFNPSPHKKKTLPISEEGQGLHP